MYDIIRDNDKHDTIYKVFQVDKTTEDKCIKLFTDYYFIEARYHIYIEIMNDLVNHKYKRALLNLA